MTGTQIKATKARRCCKANWKSEVPSKGLSTLQIRPNTQKYSRDQNTGYIIDSKLYLSFDNHLYDITIQKSGVYLTTKLMKMEMIEGAVPGSGKAVSHFKMIRSTM